MGESEKVQSLFLVCVASVYLIAFVSLFVQIPGEECLNVPVKFE